MSNWGLESPWAGLLAFFIQHSPVAVGALPEGRAARVAGAMGLHGAPSRAGGEIRGARTTKKGAPVRITFIHAKKSTKRAALRPSVGRHGGHGGVSQSRFAGQGRDRVAGRPDIGCRGIFPDQRAGAAGHVGVQALACPRGRGQAKAWTPTERAGGAGVEPRHRMSGENVNCAVKSSFLLGFLESVPEVSAKLKEPETKEQKFAEIVKSAAVLSLMRS